MKKFLALALALVMALALAVPAMAFTNEVKEDDVYTLAVELVEYEDKDFFGILSAAPSDRGYAKNEIVAFMVSFTAEKGAKFTADDAYLKVTGESVSFNVTENKDLSKLVSGATGELVLAADASFLGNVIAPMDATNKAVTYKWIGFAKVTGDDASITAEVAKVGGPASAKFAAVNTATDALSFEDDEENVYEIFHTGLAYLVNKGGKFLFKITVDAKDASKALYVYNGNDEYSIVEGKTGLIFVKGTTLITNDPKDANAETYKKLLAVVEDEFEGVFGFDYDLLGGLVTEKYFESLTDYDKLSVTVDIAPWVAYVQVPDVIVVDPPKTGDATVLVGIVMAIVAAAGVVVFNKVRA